MRTSLSLLKTAVNPNVVAILVPIMQNNARGVVHAGSPATVTDNSTGTNTGNLVAVSTAFTKGVQSGSNLSPRTAFNTAIDKIDNALAVLATYLKTDVFTPLGLPVIDLTHAGTVALAGTVAACDKALAATAGAGVAATGVLTSSANYSDGETFTIGSKVYTLQATLTNVDGHILVSAVNEAGTIANIVAAINGGAGSGTAYAAAMTTNTQVTAVGGTHTVTLTAIATGEAANSIATTETSATASFGAATLTGGVNGAGMLRSEAEAAISRQRNNLATVIRAYNFGATALGVAELTDNTGGSADPALAIAVKVHANTDEPSTGDMALDTDVDTALTALVDDISKIAAKINDPLLSSATLTGILPAALTP